MSEQLSAAAAAMNLPEDLVTRSAQARAAASGSDADTIIAAWAGGESAPATTEASAPEPETPPAATESSGEAESPPETEAAEPTPQPVADETNGAPAEPVAAPAAVTPVPGPRTVSPVEALDHDVVVSIPTAGLKERTATTIPQWLVAALMIIPAFGLLHLASNGTADAACSDSGVVLRVDRATGTLENCDGSEFAGRGGAGGDLGKFIAIGTQQYVTCAGCHGANGGGGTGPALGGVLNSFSSCADHIEWVRLGSAGFQAAGRNSYGDLGKPVNGGMPAFPSLSEEEIASVVAFERIRFGAGDPEEVATDCGLIEAAAPADGTAPVDGEAPPDGATPDSEDDSAADAGDTSEG